jgi:exonuclease VII small subunit
MAKGQKLTRLVQQTLDDARERVKEVADAGEKAFHDAKAIAS